MGDNGIGYTDPPPQEQFVIWLWTLLLKCCLPGSPLSLPFCFCRKFACGMGSENQGEKVKKRNFYNLTCVLIALCGVILRVSEVLQTHFGA